MPAIDSIEQLEAVYGKPSDSSVIKELDYLTDEYVDLIKASPMMILATCGPEGLDCTPRGDERGFVRIVDERTIIFPDRPGNNRVDSLRNIVRDGRVASLFLIPGVGTTLRVNGTATITTDSDLLASFAVGGKPPKTVVFVNIEKVFFHCARSIIRSRFWDPAAFINPTDVPSPGEILSALSSGRHGGKKYDEEWPKRAERTLW